MITNIHGFLPVYVASLEGRQLGHFQIEVGDTDPGQEWFFAQAMLELKDNETLLKPLGLG